MEYSSSLDLALLLEVRDAARRLWAGQYPQYYFQKIRCDQPVSGWAWRQPQSWIKKQFALWKKRRKAAGEKPLIRQLSIQAQPPAFEDVGGRKTKQTTIYTVAGKWGLDMGDLSVHRRADLLDPIHGYGARVTFDHVNNGPEYNNDIVMLHGAAVYRLGGMPFGDYLTQRAIVAPEELPARFASMAGETFKQMAGLR